MSLIKKIPLPMAGLLLAIMTLANLLKSFSDVLYVTLSWIGMIGLLMFTLKVMIDFKEVKKQLSHPIISSVIPTYSMAIMLVAAFLKAYYKLPSELLWYFAIILHITLIINYTSKILLPITIAKVFPSVFIVYVGIIVSSVTAPLFSIVIGQYAFYFGFASFIILFFVLVVRFIKVPEMPIPAKPTIVIFAAPASLSLVGYLSSFQDKSVEFVWLLMCLSIAITIFVVIKLPSILKLGFSPGYAALTFPLVISALALKKATLFLSITYLNGLVIAETVLATLMVLYVLIKFVHCLIKKDEKQHQKTA